MVVGLTDFNVKRSTAMERHPILCREISVPRQSFAVKSTYHGNPLPFFKLQHTAKDCRATFYENNFKNVIINGIDSNSPSNLSKNPPCPGIVEAESLIFILRLKSDSTKSP